MFRSINIFKNNINDSKNLSNIYEFLNRSIVASISFDDLLRAQFIYSVSAFDKLIHDLIRIGMIDIFLGRRAATPKYLAEAISLDIFNKLLTATIPPKEIIFEQAIAQKLKTYSYQMPDKVSEGLSYIWDEKNKWKKISSDMSMDENFVKTQLKLISSRRNSIAHESDIDPSTGLKNYISQSDCIHVNDFIEKCGLSIYNLVK